jgi:DNA-binding CsgD family transcriptional regulator
MHEPEAILLSLYRLAEEAPAGEFESQALQLVRRQLPFDSGRWMLSRKRAGAVSVIRGVYCNESPECLATYAEVRHQDTPLQDALDVPGQAVMGFKFQSRTQFDSRATSGMRAYQKKFAHENVLNVLVKQPVPQGVRFRVVALYRAREDEEFSARELAWMQALWPHLLQAQGLHARMQLAGHGEDASESMGVVDFDGFVVAAAPGFRELLQGEWGDDGAYRIPEPVWQRVSSFASTRSFIRLRKLAICAATLPHGCLVRVRMLRAEDLLAPRQLAVARLASMGRSHKEIARHLDISPNTARRHLQIIHDRLGVHKAAEIADALRAPARVSAPC